MIEAGANEIPEAKMIEAIFAAHAVNQEIIAFIDTIVAECGKPKHQLMRACEVAAELWEDMTSRPSPETRDGERGIHRCRSRFVRRISGI